VGAATVQRKVADYADRAALTVALDGVETLIFIASDDEASSMLVHHLNVIDAAAAARVGHVVYLSSLDADPGSPFCYAGVHAETERRIARSGIAFSIARVSLYGEFFAQWPLAAIGTGELRLPAADGAISLISRNDVADCLIALADQPASGSVALLTGGQAYDLDGVTELTAQCSETSIRAIDLSPAEYRMQVVRDGVSPWWAYAFGTMFAAIREQRFSEVTDKVAGLLGRPPTPFRNVLEGLLPSSHRQ